MRLKSIEISGFKSFARKTSLTFDAAITAVVGPNGSGKSNVAEALRFALGEQSMKSMRGRRGEDLIWNGSPALPRASRASVKMIFENVDRTFNLDFDEVIIERVVNRDGSNDYLLNQSHVRLRDIAELLARAGIGASGHQIISQGEADHALAATPRERRAMVEDALGLTAYIYKREEAEKKLEKTAENMREVEGLRRELAPHLKFLSQQMKKIEDGKKLVLQLEEQYREYLAREHAYLTETKKELTRERSQPEREKKEIDVHIEQLRRFVEKKGEKDDASRRITELERALSGAREVRERALRDLGRVEGEIAAANVVREIEGDVPRPRVLSFVQSIIARLEKSERSDFAGIRSVLKELLDEAKEFIAVISFEKKDYAQGKITVLQERKEKLERDLSGAQKAETKASEEIAKLRIAMEAQKDTSHEAERALFAALSRRGELESQLQKIAAQESALATDEALFEAQVREAVSMVPQAARDFRQGDILDEHGKKLSLVEILGEPRNMQRERARRLERLKIRAEEALGGSAGDIEREHGETQERDAFLARELEDLKHSSDQLHGLIDEITATLETRFRDGIEKINTQFDEFFKLLFGGGVAKLLLVKAPIHRRGRPSLPEDDFDVAGEEVDEDAEDEQDGIEVSVSLSHKRIKGLHMLSGGERALTSIALIFAMSQVNPPPFLVLDETDAALDEANSRRYGDMLEMLARMSQLIVITHNRETMSRAGVLYGITMGRDGLSKLLSVKFEEAVAVAK